MTDLSTYPTSAVIKALSEYASQGGWWKWETMVEKIQANQAAIGYESPWKKIQSASIMNWAKNVAGAYKPYPVDRQEIIRQAMNLALNDGYGEVGLYGYDRFWDGETCLAKAREYAK